MKRRIIYIWFILLATNISYSQYNVTTTSVDILSPLANTLEVGEDSHVKIPIGFNFEFYENSYDSLWIDFNGFITFQNDGPWTGSGGALIPSSSTPNNIIAACWIDASPSNDDGNGFFYNEYSYETTGSSPNRILHITFDLNESCNGTYFNGQIKLFESSNKIEIHTSNWNTDGNNCTNATQGIENSDGSLGFYYSNRSGNENWQSYGDAIAFTVASDVDLALPQAGSSIYCEGSNEVGVYVYNNGIDIIDSFDIKWEWDNVYQDSQRIIATVLPSTYFYMPLGYKTFGTLGNQHQLKAWIVNSNGQPEVNTSNDTLQNTNQITGLKGIYTIGGTTPDYATITAAINDLHTYGACDSVYFNIRPGTYNEQMDIHYFNSLYTVFRSENGDSSSVIIQSNNPFSVRLNNVFNLHFKNLTIKSTSIPDKGTIVINNYCVQNSISNCEIVSSIMHNGDITAAIFFSGHAGEIDITNNLITNGRYGIYMEEYNGNYRDNIEVLNNVFIDPQTSGIQSNNTTGLKIKDNKIYSSNLISDGINLRIDVGNVNIENNKITLTGGAQSGLTLDNLSSVNIYNNMISLKSVVSVGIPHVINLLPNVFNVDIQYNTLHIYGYTNFNTNVISSQFGNILHLKNNILDNRSGGYIYVIHNNFPQDVRNNVIYTQAVSNAIIVGNTYTNLAGLQNAGYETNSHFSDVLFTSDEDLHSVDGVLNRQAIPSNVIYDIDGDLRDNTLPDIGANEFIGSNYDVTVSEILSPIPYTCMPNQDLVVVVKNTGEQSIDSFKINYKIEGQIDDSLWIHRFITVNDTIHLNLANISLGSNDTTSFLVYTSLPNGVQDGFVFYDTINLQHRQSYQGTLTIGGINPTFNTIQQAFKNLSSHGVCGPVILNIRSGIYSEQIIADSIPGASSTNTITLQSETMDSNAVTIQYLNTDQYKRNILDFKNAKYLTIQHLTIKNLNGSYGDVLFFREKGNNININSCSFYSAATSFFAAGGALITFVGSITKFENLEIKDNHLNNGLRSMACFSCNNVIVENNYSNTLREGIVLNGISNTNVKNNIVEKYNNFDGVLYSSSTAGGLNTIANNKFIATLAGNGIYLNGSHFSNLEGNSTIYNNFISTGNRMGLKIWNSDNLKIYHNNINATGTLTNECYAIEIVNSDTLDIRNNIFKSNNQKILRHSSMPINANVIDYNVYYNSTGDFASWQDIDQANFANWKTTTGFDMHSYNVNPNFVSETDLHVLSTIIDGTATPLVSITNDIDKASRNILTPDIGADEVGTAANDAGILGILPQPKFKRGLHPIKAIIRNYGNNPLTSTMIKWSINGVAQTDFIYSGNIASLAKDTVIIGSYNFQLNNATSIRMNTHLPNGVVDLYPSNDSSAVFNLFPSLSDTIIIANNSSIPTISAAIQAIENGGVLDSIHFMIPNGTYHHSYTFNSHQNYSCNLPVIFEAQNGLVIWDNLAINNAPLVLNGADGLRFKNITFKATSNSYGTAVSINNGSDCNTFENCTFESTSTSNVYLVNSESYSIDKKNSFYTCNFLGCYGGLNLTNDDSITVFNCNFLEQRYLGIFTNSLTNSTIKSNELKLLTSTNHFKAGIYAYASKNLYIRDNFINVSGLIASGIRIRFVSDPYNLYIYNNFIIHNGTNSIGIWHEANSNCKIYNNSVLGGGNNSSSFYINGNALGNEIKNNIAYNKFAGSNKHVIQILDPQNSINSDFNNFYIDGGNIGYINGVSYSTLSNWKTSGNDMNSISEDPEYISDNDLHTTSSFLNGTATPLALVTNDIDGDVRDILHPDIGADEFTPVTHDVGILAINGPTMPFPSGNNYVYIKFQNNGIDTLTSMQVNWSVNGVMQAPYNWSGILPSAATYDSLDIGQYDFTPFNKFDIKVWVGSPNGVVDQLAVNDTLYKNNLYAALNGTYTIGGSNPTFDLINEAVSALNNGGIIDNVNMNIRPGIYSDTIIINPYLGSDCIKKVSFQSESGNSSDAVINNLGYSAPTIQLKGADGIAFKDLTLESVNPVHRRTIVYEQGASCNLFENNIIKTLAIGAGYNPSAAIAYSPGSQDTSNLFIGNQFVNGSIALLDEGGAKHNIISGNTFTNQSSLGVHTYYGHSLHYKDNITIKDGNYQYDALRIESMNGACEISGNKFNLNDNANTAITFTNVSDPLQKSIIKNNFININGANNHTSYGIVASGSENVGIYNNSLRANTNHTNLYSVNGIKLEGGSSVDIKNNIISIPNSGYTLYKAGGSNFTSNRNDLYKSSGSNFLFSDVVYHDIATWRTASSQDINSINQNPEFVSEEDLHTHLTLLNGQGATLPEVAVDIDGDIRQSPPDIGADEFDPLPTDDAGILRYAGPVAPFASGVQNVKLVLKNFGGNPLISAKVRWVVNGIEQSQYTWTGNLASAACDTFTVGNFNFTPYQSQQIIAWTELPNNNTDTTNINDTIAMDNVYPALTGVYSLGGFLPDFNLFSQFQNALHFGGVLGNVTVNVREGNYNHNLLIDSFPGLANNYIIKLQSESHNYDDVHLSTAAYRSDLLNMKAIHHIEIINITFDHPNEVAINLENGSHHITVDSCVFNGGSNSYSYGVNSESSVESFISVKNSIFNKGWQGIKSIGSWGGRDHHFTIEKNIFKDQSYERINFHHHENLSLINNKFEGSVNSGQMVYLVDVGQNSEVSNNRLFSSSNASIGYLIQWGAGNSSDYNKFYNNFIYSNNTEEFQGVYFNQNANWNIDNNTIHNKNGIPLLIWGGYSGSQFNIRNNVFKTEGHDVAFWAAYGMHSANVLDYNNYHTNGTPLLSIANVDYPSVVALQQETLHEDHGIQKDPFIVTDGQPQIKQTALNNTGLQLTYLTKDIDNALRNNSPDIGAKEFTPLTNDVGVTSIISPVDDCDLGMENIVIAITNFGSNVVSNFNVAYKFDNNNYIIQNIGSRTILPGDTIHFKFASITNFTPIGFHAVRARTLLGSDTYAANDSLEVDINNIPSISTPPTNLIPIDNTLNTEATVSLSWLPATNATKYDLYYWNTNGSRPASPSKENLSIINTSITSLAYGESYFWQIQAKNECGQTMWSDTNKFTVRQLPDLVVDTVISPLSGFSGQQISVEYFIKNIGLGNTQSALWLDAIYLSNDQTLNTSFDTYLGSIANLTALNQSQSYTHSQSVTLPQGSNGNYYIIVRADYYNNLLELNNTNNTKYRAIPINITLTPPPDLRVINVTGPSLSFSGQNVNFSYLVKNLGTGNTLVNAWKDRIILRNEASNPNSLFEVIKTIDHNGILTANSEYLVNSSFTIPANIFGLYQIEVQTDVFNNVYEFAAENNNSGVSNNMNVVLTAPADLIPDSIIIPDSVHLYGNFNYQFQIKNKGGSVVPSGWSDRIILSKSPIDNPNFYIQFGNVYSNSGLAPNMAKKYQYTANMSNLNQNIGGDHYWYFIADQYNQVNEWTFEANNTLRSMGKTYVKQPDLVMETMTIPPAEIAGTNMTFESRIKNLGLGNYNYSTLNLKYYISTDSTYNVNSDVLIGQQTLNNLNIESNDIDSFFQNINLPAQYFGNFHIICLVDANNNCFETNENNNIFISNKILIYNGIVPNIEVSNIIIPSIVTAGKSFTLSYTTQNIGDIDIVSSFTDSIFISFSSTWNRTGATYMGLQSYNSLDTETVLNIQLPLSTNITQTSNVYYLYIISDAKNQIFEGIAGENDNIKRSNAFTLSPYASIDLNLLSIGNLPDTLVFGQSYSLIYNVKNQGLDATYYSSWTDKFYLSIDSIFDQNDIEVGNYSYSQGSIKKDSTKNVATNLIIPNGIVGDYYLLVKIDAIDVNKDINLINNKKWRTVSNMAKRIHIKPGFYPDIVPVNFTTPIEITAGLYFNIYSESKNQGVAIAGGRYDRIFLSNDASIGIGDLELSSKLIVNHAINLAIKDTQLVYLPANYSGNYYLIYSTDHNQNIYEFGNEHNNKMLVSINILAPPPSDLVVTEISVPSNVLAGKRDTIRWITKNIGANPSSAQLREILYLSTDETWDVNDEVIAIKDQNIFIPPAGKKSNILEVTYNNVTNGDYHTIIKTDARNNVLESNEANNDGVSVVKTNIDIEEIFLEVIKSDNFNLIDNYYYKVKVEAEDAGRNLLITLQGDTLLGQTELFVKFGSVPTQADNDAAYDKPYQSNQELLIRNIVPGYYYILAKGRMKSNATTQSIKLHAEIKRMYIKDFNPKKGSNKGWVTMIIDGSELDSLETVELVLDDTTKYHAIQADTFISLNNGEKVIARFNLLDEEIGWYDLQCVRPDGFMARKKSSFEVISGEVGNIAVSWSFSPGSFQSGIGSLGLCQITLNVENLGDTDIENHEIRVGGPFGDNNMYYSLKDYYDQILQSNLLITAEDEIGFDGILKPKSKRVYHAYGQWTSYQGFTINY